jgi:CubicO group peptidase (beta-lactamase class C family)
VPTINVSRGNAPPSVLPRRQRDDLDDVGFCPLGASTTMSWADSLGANYTDGIVVLHQGHIVYERYFGALQPAGQHIVMSVTKSLIGTIAAMLIDEGALDETAPVSRYVPELGRSAFGDARICDLLDMTSALQYSENYADPSADFWAYARAGGFLPRATGDAGPATFYEFLQTVGKDGEHGKTFTYKTVNTDALGWVIHRVTGKAVGENLSERIWQPIGAEQDAYFTIDTAGIEFAGAGLNASLRDLARFGEMMRLEGAFHGQQIVPKAVVDRIRQGGSREKFAKAGYLTCPGWSYRNMWWVSHNEHGVYTARGIHGQAIYIDPSAQMVIARFASFPRAANINLDPTSLPAYHALAKHLIDHP